MIKGFGRIKEATKPMSSMMNIAWNCTYEKTSTQYSWKSPSHNHSWLHKCILSYSGSSRLIHLPEQLSMFRLKHSVIRLLGYNEILVLCIWHGHAIVLKYIWNDAPQKYIQRQLLHIDKIHHSSHSGSPKIRQTWTWPLQSQPLFLILHKLCRYWNFIPNASVQFPRYSRLEISFSNP